MVQNQHLKIFRKILSRRIAFAGLKLTNKGIKLDSSKADAVTKAKVPTNVTEVRTF